jgi:hypothetical protein
MKITLGLLRSIIREEVERNMLRLAGSFMGTLSQPSKGANYMPLPGLGASTERENDTNTGENEKEEEEFQGIDDRERR